MSYDYGCHDGVCKKLVVAGVALEKLNTLILVGEIIFVLSLRAFSGIKKGRFSCVAFSSKNGVAT